MKKMTGVFSEYLLEETNLLPSVPSVRSVSLYSALFCLDVRNSTCFVSYLWNVLQEPEEVLPGIITVLDMDTIDFWLSKCKQSKSWQKIKG